MFTSSLEDHQYSRMKFRLLPSLKSLVLTKIATVILNRADVRVTAWNINFVIEDTPSRVRRMIWKQFENYVINISYTLPIPYDVRKELFRHIAGTAWELFLWLEFHVSRCKIVPKIPESFIWTSHGLIDKKSMAQLLVKDTELDIISRYKLACLYCLESDIVELWKHIRIGRNFEKHLRKKKLDEPDLVPFWSQHVAGKMKLMHRDMSYYCKSDTFTPNECAFRISVASGNEVATRFFFAKLNPEEKKRLPTATIEGLVRQASGLKEMMLSCCQDFPGEHHTGVLCFFLEEVIECDQSELFEEDSYLLFYFHLVLQCFLDWPYQDVFTKAVEYWNKYCDSDSWYHLLRKITKKLGDEFCDYDYSKLFVAVWNSIRPSDMRDVVQSCLCRGFLLDLFDHCHTELIHLVFEEASSTDKESFILSECGEFICKRLMVQNNWCRLSNLIFTCISSKENLMGLMAKLLKIDLCERVGKNNSDGDVEGMNQNDFLQILWELLKTKCNKRNANDVQDQSAKRFRC